MSFYNYLCALVILSFVSFSSLVCKNVLPMHYRLYIHYFLASGKEVNETFFTKKEHKMIQRLCSVEQLKINEETSFVYVSEEKHLVNTYDMAEEIEYSFGTFTCKGGYALDLYDFWYANSAAEYDVPPQSTLRQDVDWCVNNAATALGHGGQGQAGVGRCLVIKGYGKPFEIKIKI